MKSVCNILGTNLPVACKFNIMSAPDESDETSFMRAPKPFERFLHQQLPGTEDWQPDKDASVHCRTGSLCLDSACNYTSVVSVPILKVTQEVVPDTCKRNEEN